MIPTAANALDAVRRGWHLAVLHSVRSDGTCTCWRAWRCTSPGKHPVSRGWQKEHALTTPADVDHFAHLTIGGHAPNYAVLTGARSGLLVLDIDPRHGGDDNLHELEAIHGFLPATAEVLTGGGGRHIYFAHPGGYVEAEWRLAAELAPGVELKGEGGSVTGIGSLHASGQRYEWELSSHPDDVGLASAPEWVTRPRSTGGRAKGRSTTRTPTTASAADQSEFANLWAVIGIDLRPGVSAYLCPFHDDHAPSLNIDVAGTQWHCFACQAGGGLVTLDRLVAHEVVPMSPPAFCLPEVGNPPPSGEKGGGDIGAPAPLPTDKCDGRLLVQWLTGDGRDHGYLYADCNTWGCRRCGPALKAKWSAHFLAKSAQVYAEGGTMTVVEVTTETARKSLLKRINRAEGEFACFRFDDRSFVLTSASVPGDVLSEDKVPVVLGEVVAALPFAHFGGGARHGRVSQSAGWKLPKPAPKEKAEPKCRVISKSRRSDATMAARLAEVGVTYYSDVTKGGRFKVPAEWVDDQYTYLQGMAYLLGDGPPP